MEGIIETDVMPLAQQIHTVLQKGWASRWDTQHLKFMGKSSSSLLHKDGRPVGELNKRERKRALNLSVVSVIAVIIIVRDRCSSSKTDQCWSPDDVFFPWCSPRAMWTNSWIGHRTWGGCCRGVDRGSRQSQLWSCIDRSLGTGWPHCTWNERHISAFHT